MKGKYDDIIIDAGGRDTINQRASLSIADKLIVPFVPRSFDLWTLEKVASILNEIQQINKEFKADSARFNANLKLNSKKSPNSPVQSQSTHSSERKALNEKNNIQINNYEPLNYDHVGPKV